MPESKYDLVANTYTAKEQSFALMEVGDAKQPDAFYPQVKIMRWDNECNFSARLVHKETSPEVSLVDDKIQWVGNAVEAHFYEIGEGKEGGGYEFEIILKEPPKSNIISMTLQTKGLDFLYQPELTEEEIKKGCERPDNVVGSYAVYHQTMAGDYTALGGKNYKAGKAFHIFRPRIEDDKGNWVWGVLNIDEKDGLLTVTIPQDFLDKAVYPVHHAAGLEFGYHTIGGSNDYYGGPWKLYVKAASTPESDGSLDSISVYARIHSGTPNFCPALYSDDADVPDARLAAVNTGGTPFPADFAWVTTDISYPTIVSGTQYWLGVKEQTELIGYFDTKYDSGWLSKYTSEVPSDWPITATNLQNFISKESIYATYTAAAGGGLASLIGGKLVNKGILNSLRGN